MGNRKARGGGDDAELCLTTKGRLAIMEAEEISEARKARIAERVSNVPNSQIKKTMAV